MHQAFPGGRQQEASNLVLNCVVPFHHLDSLLVGRPSLRIYTKTFRHHDRHSRSSPLRLTLPDKGTAAWQRVRAAERVKGWVIFLANLID